MTSAKLLFALGLIPLAAAQTTKVDIARQTRNADFSNASFTKPFRMVVSLPAACSGGEAILKLPEAAPYICHPANTWIAISAGTAGGASGPLALAQSTDFAVAFTGGTATMGANCNTSTPCNAAFGAQVFQFTNSASVSSLSGMTTASTVYFFVSSGGVRTFGVPGSAGATVSNMALMNNVTSFPTDSLPIASCAVLNNQFTACTDFRAFLRGFNVSGTNGISVSRTANGFLIDYAGSATAENPTFGAVMNNGAPAPGNLNVPGAYLSSASNVAVVRFPGTESVTVSFSQALPEEWTGPLDAEIYWTLASGSGNVQWKASTSCVAAGGSLAYNWNTFVGGGVQAAASGAVLKTSFSGATALPVGGCAPGTLLRVAVTRDNAVSGNAGADAHLVSVRLKIRKSS